MQAIIKLQRLTHKTSNNFDRYYLTADDGQFFSMTSLAEGFGTVELAEGHQYVIDYYVKTLDDGREFKNVSKIEEAYDLTDNQKMLFLLGEMNRKLDTLMGKASGKQHEVPARHAEVRSGIFDLVPDAKDEEVELPF